MKRFNTTGTCYPEDHYMVDLTERCQEIKAMVDRGDYFCINHGRQYGKTTTLESLKNMLDSTYSVFFLSFENIGNNPFEDENTLSLAFLKLLKEQLDCGLVQNVSAEFCTTLNQYLNQPFMVTMIELNVIIRKLCSVNNVPVVIFIDEVDQASNYEAFLKFLGVLRGIYLSKKKFPTFQSVILAGVYNIKNLKLKIRQEDEHQYNSPWNIAAKFKVNMSLETTGIAGMLQEYESDHHTGMDINAIAQMLADDTAGYPFLVSRLCQIMDEELMETGKYSNLSECWTKYGVMDAENILLKEKNTLFDDLIKKLNDFPQLYELLRSILLNGEEFTYSADERIQNLASMFNYIRDNNGNVAVSNRIFETRLYNLFILEENKEYPSFRHAAATDSNIFVSNGHLNMELVLERFVEHFNDLFPAGKDKPKWVEEDARKCFLMYIRPIINGSGHYFIESRTRDTLQMDLVITYLKEEFIIEMKIWRGKAYNDSGIEQLCGYLESRHATKGYLVSFNFNQKKESGITTTQYGKYTIVEAVV